MVQLPTPPPTLPTTRRQWRSKTQKRRETRQRAARRRAAANLAAANANEESWGTTRPDWGLEQVHCKDCHLTEGRTIDEGQSHWGCTPFPGLNKDTCPQCNSHLWIDVYDVNPFLYLVDSPALQYLVPGIRVVKNHVLDSYYFHKVVEFVIAASLLALFKLL